jgi:hypothetical protein
MAEIGKPVVKPSRCRKPDPPHGIPRVVRTSNPFVLAATGDVSCAEFFSLRLIRDHLASRERLEIPVSQDHDVNIIA